MRDGEGATAAVETIASSASGEGLSLTLRGPLKVGFDIPGARFRHQPDNHRRGAGRPPRYWMASVEALVTCLAISSGPLKPSAYLTTTRTA